MFDNMPGEIPYSSEYVCYLLVCRKRDLCIAGIERIENETAIRAGEPA
jgi:hypothetical protein